MDYQKIEDKVNYLDLLYKEKIFLESMFFNKGYKFVEASLFEDYDVFVNRNKFIDAKNLVKCVLQDGSVKLLRPDITSSLIDNLGWNETCDREQKLFYYARTYRYNKSKAVENRQIGIEYLKEKSKNEKEIFDMMYEILSRYQKGYLLEIGSAKFLRTLLGLYDFQGNDYKKVMDCITNKDTYALKNVLKNYTSKYNDLLINVFSLTGVLGDILIELDKYSLNEELMSSVRDLIEIENYLNDKDDFHYTYDLSLVNKYDYYDGVIFNAYIKHSNKSCLKGGNYSIKSDAFDAIGFVIDLDEVVKAGVK